MTSRRMLRVARGKQLEDRIAEYYWNHMEVHVWPGNPWYQNVALYHVWLVFGVRLTWEDLMYVIYH